MSYIREARRSHKRLARQMMKPLDTFYKTPMSDEVRVESALYALRWFCEASDIDFDTCLTMASECFEDNKRVYEAEDAIRDEVILERYI